MAEDDTARIFYLVVEEFAKILHIHLALVDVNDSGKCVERGVVIRYALDCANDIRQLSDARWFYQNAIGTKAIEHLCECLSEVTDE